MELLKLSNLYFIFKLIEMHLDTENIILTKVKQKEHMKKSNIN